ncbi:valine--tRNA ligase [Candidatus Fermentibacterales bacterium]|nr:valine--tRNA ligase [Candidatus Fermentibacterales bacterium]
MSDPLPKRYDPKEAEPRLQRQWQETSIYRFSAARAAAGECYSIDTPPPTVSGMIHMGHIFSYVQAEVIARYHRMRGEEVFYPFCFDDNGLPSERFTEREKGVRARDLPREEFVRLCLEATSEAERGFRDLWTRMGFSCDWDEIYTTIDPWVQRLSQRSFIELARSGRAYRKSMPSLWCTECHTGVAQAESEDEEVPSVFYDLEFELAGGGRIPIATTRPELIPACVAVFANPEDPRWKGIVGKRAVVPLSGGREVPIHADSRVDIEKGSGVVMCCTFGDTTDIDWWEEYGLEQRIIIDRTGRMNELAGFLEGLGTGEARKRIAERLREEGLLHGGRDIVHTVNVHERCHTPLEYLVQPQWFIRVLDIKEELLERGRQIAWHPDYFRARFEHWVENLRWDWSISRQRYYGVPFPVWYCRCGETILAAEDRLPVDPLAYGPGSACPRCGATDGFEPEADVLDTWATSSMTPLINAKWREEGERRHMIPMTVRPQAHDIIRTWAFYSIVKSHLHEGTVPWRHLMVSGHALNPSREKMSKSKGNVAGDPLAALELYSADELRYWACSSKLGTDVVFSEEILGLGRRLVTKIWNATRFASGHLADFDPSSGPGKLLAFDRWLLSRLHALVERATKGMDDYDYFTCLKETETFFWSCLCDNYLEIAKRRLYGEPGPGRNAARHTLRATLYCCLRLFAPILPHITEELYLHLFHEREGKPSIHLCPWPDASAIPVDEEAMRLGDLALQIIEEARRHKSESNLSMAAPLQALEVACPSEADMKGLLEFEEDLLGVTRAAEIRWIVSPGEPLTATVR